MRISPPDNDLAPARGWRVQLSRAWRLIGTAVSFSVFGLGGLVFTVFAVPMLWLFVHPARRRADAGRWLISKAFAGFVRIMRLLGVLRYRISGLEHVGDSNRCLVVANHPSLIDVVFLLAIFQKADCVVKYAHWTNPFTMAPVRTANYVSNRDLAEIMLECIQRLKDGATLVLFPEGTRTSPGEAPTFPRAAATIAVRAGARCLPVRLSCAPTTLTKADRWYQIPRRVVQFDVQILAPLDSGDFLEAASSERQACFAFNRKLMELLCPPLENAAGSVKLSPHGRAIPD